MVRACALIGDISLCSAGIADVRELERERAQAYTLCSEQLSSQEHHDYGMRALKTALNVSANK